MSAMKCSDEAKKSLVRILQSSFSALPDVKPSVGLTEAEMEVAGTAESPHGGKLPVEPPALQVTRTAS